MVVYLGFFPTGRVLHWPSAATPHRRSLTPCPTDAFSGHGGAATPAAMATATTTERSQDATDNRDTDLHTVEEAALSVEHTTNAYFF